MFDNQIQIFHLICIYVYSQVNIYMWQKLHKMIEWEVCGEIIL
jgi:hypothetical protein